VHRRVLRRRDGVKAIPLSARLRSDGSRNAARRRVVGRTMTSQDTPRVGFCCKYVSPIGDTAAERHLNLIGTTIAALSRLDRTAALAKAIGIVEHNMAALAARSPR